MLKLSRPADFGNHIGKKLGQSDWFTIEQSHISQFASLTGDDFWIHVDEKKAYHEMPEGRTIAHGLFIISLIPFLQRQIFQIERRGKGLNYGSNRVRYIEPVKVNSRIRLHQTLETAQVSHQSTKIITHNVFEVDGKDKPAVVADFILLLFEEDC